MRNINIDTSSHYQIEPLDYSITQDLVDPCISVVQPTKQVSTQNN